MKNLVLTMFVLLSTTLMIGQETENKHSYGFIANAKLGFAKLNQSGFVTINGNVNSGDIQFFYSLPSGTYFSTGIGLLEFNANGVSGGESFALEHSYLRIPLYINRSVPIFKDQANNKIHAFGGVGIYANTLLKEEIQTLTTTFKEKNMGWNIGLGFNVGLTFEVIDNMSFGLGFDTQSDLTKMKKNEVERKLETINTVNFIYKINF